MKIILIAVAFVTAFVIVFQAITIQNMKKGQEEQFYEHIAASAQSFERYKESGAVHWYEDAVVELHCACSIAGLLEDRGDYRSVHNVLLSLLKKYSYCPNEPEMFPDDLGPYIDETVVALNDFSTDCNVKKLYTKLHSINAEMIALWSEKAEQNGLILILDKML